MSPPRRVVYVVVDGMSTEAFEQVTASGRAPALAYLKSVGSYVRDSVAVFPTITPVATASLVTGATPAEHGIPGMCWYDRDAERFVNYGQSPRVAVVEGVRQIVHDVLFNLNSRHLSPRVQTIHERLDAMGLTTASMNFMVFRGPHAAHCDPSLLERLVLGGSLPEELHGPREHYFADVVTGSADACSKLLSGRGVEKRVRATDGWAACVTRDLLEKDAADMILFYLHENDHVSHRKGPVSQTENLVKADEHIAHVLESLGTWEKTCSEVGFVVTSDHAQSPISSEGDHIIDFNDVLGDFDLLSPGRGREVFEDADAAVAGNGRVALVYLNADKRSRVFMPVVDSIAACSGVDQVMWRDRDQYVIRSDRGTLRFRGSESEGVVDERGNKWQYEGDLEAVSGVVEENLVRTPEYPLALWRVKSALDLDRMGDVVATMKLTYETADLAGGDHRGGGDHASLHVQDSNVPFLSTLAQPPAHPSTVDVCSHIVEHFERLRSG